jgi:putative endonuclease
MKRKCIYIMTNKWRTVLYTGVTSNLERRRKQHRESGPNTFCRRYRACDVIYVEWFNDIRDAIAREKEIKKYSRAKKLKLIASANPTMRALEPPGFT